MIFVDSFDKVVGNIDSLTRRYIFNYANNIFPISINLKPSNKLVVFFPGAFDLKMDMPKFQREGYFDNLPYNVVSLFDPTLIKHNGLSIAWFQGNKETDLFNLLFPILKNLADLLKIDYSNIIFFGSSAGGIPAVKIAKNFRYSNVYLGNVQTNALKYYQGSVDKMLEACYPAVSTLDLYKHKLSIMDDYGDINIYYAQNLSDSFHYAAHFKPFVDAAEGKFKSLETVLYKHDASGHNPISKDFELDIINSIFDKKTIKHLYSELESND